MWSYNVTSSGLRSEISDLRSKILDPHLGCGQGTGTGMLVWPCISVCPGTGVSQCGLSRSVACLSVWPVSQCGLSRNVACLSVWPASRCVLEPGCLSVACLSMACLAVWPVSQCGLSRSVACLAVCLEPGCLSVALYLGGYPGTRVSQCSPASQCVRETRITSRSYRRSYLRPPTILVLRQRDV